MQCDEPALWTPPCNHMQQERFDMDFTQTPEFHMVGGVAASAIVAARTTTPAARLPAGPSRQA